MVSSSGEDNAIYAHMCLIMILVNLFITHQYKKIIILNHNYDL